MKRNWNMTKINESCHPGLACVLFKTYIPAWRQTSWVDGDHKWRRSLCPVCCRSWLTTSSAPWTHKKKVTLVFLLFLTQGNRSQHFKSLHKYQGRFSFFLFFLFSNSKNFLLHNTHHSRTAASKFVCFMLPFFFFLWLTHLKNKEWRPFLHNRKWQPGKQWLGNDLGNTLENQLTLKARLFWLNYIYKRYKNGDCKEGFFLPYTALVKLIQVQSTVLMLILNRLWNYWRSFTSPEESQSY